MIKANTLRAFWRYGAFLIILVTGVCFAGQEMVISGTVTAAPEDPAGKLAPIVIECKDGTYQVAKNAVAVKLQKSWIGKKVEVTGAVENSNGIKVITPWMYIEAGAKPKIQPTG